MPQINIEIAYAFPDHYYLKRFQLEAGTTVQTAILQSGVLQQFTEIDLRENKVGIFSRPAKLTDPLQDGDRIEIYRPLLADPKDIRRKRAEQQQHAQQAQKQAEKLAAKAAKAAQKEAQND
ncbi:RnfH family protein [Necropsobacter massiliensis]|uniref:RnfH family protein n=1 Tax=Necropsobacter massiliensis TaxID=1400001 RepID=UPI0005960B72|nr:RnfH family protein [Necropsobacter massiliensis]